MKVPAEKIMNNIIGNARTLMHFGPTLGNSVSTILDKDDTKLETKLYGFNSNHKGAVIEVKINGTLIERISLKRPNVESEFAPQYKYDFNKLYYVRTKEKSKPPVEEFND